jgi:2-keto-3-deoxy-galactonokinase
MASNLLVRAIHDAHLAFHEAFERWITKAAGQREYVLNALFLKRSSKQIAAADSSLTGHCSFLTGLQFRPP